MSINYYGKREKEEMNDLQSIDAKTLVAIPTLENQL